jgi:hypothetical protein
MRARRFAKTLRLGVRRAARKAGLLPELPFRYPYIEIVREARHRRPNYLWGTICGAGVAKNLGYGRISVIEFGVAGGNGLLALEQAAEAAERLTGVDVDVYGFDTGTGLTRPQDYRDLPQLWSEGDFAMDVPALQARLGRAKLTLGPVEKTVPEFVRGDPAPVGFVSFDLDLYSSTMHAFQLFEGPTRCLLPRITCYFDDIMGGSHSDFAGERLAINEFNATHELRKISRIFGLPYYFGPRMWTEMMYMFHAFDHERHNDYDGMNWIHQITLDPA